MLEQNRIVLLSVSFLRRSDKQDLYEIQALQKLRYREKFQTWYKTSTLSLNLN